MHRTHKRKPHGRYKGVTTGHRCMPERWAVLLILAKRKGLSGNALLNRLVDHAIAHEWVPEFIEDPIIHTTKESDIVSGDFKFNS